MSVIYLLIVISLVVALVFLGGFIWAVRSGQFEDTTTPPMRILGDEPGPVRASLPSGGPKLNETYER